MSADHLNDGLKIVLGQLSTALTAGRYWRWAFFGSLPLLAMAILGCLLLGAQPKEKAYYVEIDRCSGDVRVVGPAPETYTVHTLAVEATVRRFVEDLRAISDSPETTKAAWRRLYHQVTMEEGRPKLEKQEQEWQPTLQRKPVYVKVLRLLAREPTRYDVVWQEQRYSEKRVLEETKTYSGQLAFKMQSPRTKEEREHAPLGIFFYHWAWSGQ